MMAVMTIMKDVVNTWMFGCMLVMCMIDTMMPSMMITMVTVMNMIANVNRYTMVNWVCH